MQWKKTYLAIAFLAFYAENAYAEMDGLGFLIVFAFIGIVILGYPLLSILAGSYVERKLTEKGYRSVISIPFGIAATLVIFLIPFADYPYKRMKVNQYCSEEGGFHITKSVSGVEGIFGLPQASKYGYQYGEDYWTDIDRVNGTNLHRIFADNKVPRVINVDAPSTYGYRMNRTLIESSIYRIDLQTYVTGTGEELGRFVYFENEHGYRPWMKMSCQSMKNENYYKYIPELLQKTLQPASQ